jgi:outer membrane protein TolC
LANRIGINEDFMLAIQNLPEMKLTIEELIQLAYKNRPEVELVQQRIELANRQYNLEHFKLIPWPTYVDFVQHIDNAHRYNKTLNTPWNEVRFGLTLPIFNWNIGNMKATNLAVKNKEDELGAIKESIEDEVRAAYIKYMDLLLDWKNFSEDADDLITNADAIVQQAKTYNTLMPDEVVEMKLTIVDTQKLLAEKQHNLAQALIELYFSLGIETNP